MVTTYVSRTLSVSIHCPADQVYAFAANPENLPKWAKGLGNTVKRRGAEWLVETSQGPVTVRFTEKNRFGVLDHYVTTPAGETVYVPMRVLANASGSEVLFTLFRLPGMSDGQFAEDAKLVEQDLATLKALLERP